MKKCKKWQRKKKKIKFRLKMKKCKLLPINQRKTLYLQFVSERA